jgi:hypothetical protein
MHSRSLSPSAASAARRTSPDAVVVTPLPSSLYETLLCLRRPTGRAQLYEPTYRIPVSMKKLTLSQWLRRT